jgi:hypothetical protein
MMAASKYQASYQQHQKKEPFELPSLFGRQLTGRYWLNNWLALADNESYNPTLAGVGWYWLKVTLV